MGVASLWGFAVVGVEALAVRVEAHARNGLPGITIVGLPGAAVREARERVRSAAASSLLPLPTRRITVNLSPGDVPKDGPGFDLPVALAMLAGCGCLPGECLTGVAAVGELSLEGTVRPTRGVLPVAETASKMSLGLLLIPVEGLPVAKEVARIPIAGVRNLREAVAVLREPSRRSWIVSRGERWLRTRANDGEGEEDVPDLSDVLGQQQAKRALEIAAAGGHHMLMLGAPGSGKTMLARRLAGILPPLTREEAVDVARVWSAVGLRDANSGLPATRPFRAPHHTASCVALVGGGAGLRPGEVSLAHRGVLFLDELPEFSRDALEALRQPLEERRVVISRRTGSSTFPAACTVIGAMNPCPCGYFGHARKACQCSAASIQRYRARISGPLLDRIDALIEVPPLTLAELDSAGRGESSCAVAERVSVARQFARERAARNAGAAPVTLELREDVSDSARALLREALVSENLSGRGYAKVVGLARTIADLDFAQAIRAEHAAEALSMRVDYQRLGLL